MVSAINKANSYWLVGSDRDMKGVIDPRKTWHFIG